VSTGDITGIATSPATSGEEGGMHRADATPGLGKSLARRMRPTTTREVHPVVLELGDVTKSYDGEPPVVALAGVSFAVTEGELVAIVGPSGSGKSTLLHMMGTLDRPSTGAVRITGLDVLRFSDRQLAALRGTHIGFVFQQFFLAEHATAIENVADGLLYTGTPFRARH
jgi:putative ABC transport system ATP-binding protein